jgi:hypothetical protein
MDEIMLRQENCYVVFDCIFGNFDAIVGFLIGFWVFWGSFFGGFGGAFLVVELSSIKSLNLAFSSKRLRGQKVQK